MLEGSIVADSASTRQAGGSMEPSAARTAVRVLLGVTGVIETADERG